MKKLKAFTGIIILCCFLFQCSKHNPTGTFLPGLPRYLSKAENHIVSEFASKWGTFGMVEPTLAAMRFLEDSSYDYFINLTEDCYPIKSPSQISRTFEGQNVGFVTFWKMPYEGWHQGGMNRINNRYSALPGAKK